MKPFVLILLIGFAFGNVICGQERERMLILTCPHFEPHIQSYITYRASDGIDCQTLIVDDSEDFQSIKSKIQSAQTAFSADYLLIIGDDQHIASLRIDEGLSDMAYCLLGNGDAPTMVCGRFPAHTLTDLQTLIVRSTGLIDCSRTVVGLASAEVSDLTDSADYQIVQTVLSDLHRKGFTDFHHLYDGSQGGADADGSPNYQDVLQSLSRGACLFFYAGNGGYDGWNTGGFRSEHIDSLSFGVELPFLISASCLGGHFADRTCFAQKWMLTCKDGQPIGARAMLASSNLTDWDATLSAFSVIATAITSTESRIRIGELYRIAYEHISKQMLREKDAQCWVLFGDPSLRLFASNTHRIIDINEEDTSSVLRFLGRRVFCAASSGNLFLYDAQGRMTLNQNIEQGETLTFDNFSKGVYVAVLVLLDGSVMVEKISIF